VVTDKQSVFERYAADYDRWFDDHAEVYCAELRLIQRAVLRGKRMLEVGVGSGRFAVPLGIEYGLDPSRPLTTMAKARGIGVVLGCAEHLPYRGGSFDNVLMMTVICFVDNIPSAFQEVCRVLVPSGRLIIGFLERDGEIFRHYHSEPEKGRFLRHARFYTVKEIVRALENAGFSSVEITARSRGFCVLTANRPSTKQE
jgi:ubiquinone/menaquinone biosynthesis C-methylase UbiE